MRDLSPVISVCFIIVPFASQVTDRQNHFHAAVYADIKPMTALVAGRDPVCGKHLTETASTSLANNPGPSRRNLILMFSDIFISYIAAVIGSH